MQLSHPFYECYGLYNGVKEITVQVKCSNAALSPQAEEALMSAVCAWIVNSQNMDSAGANLHAETITDITPGP